jgi:hypothetical protein
MYIYTRYAYTDSSSKHEFINSVTYRVVHAIKKTGSGSDDWIC